LKAILVLTILLLLVTPCMAIGEGKPIATAQKSVNLLEDGPALAGNSPMSLYRDRSANEASILAADAVDIQPNQYSNSSAILNSISLLDLDYTTPSFKSSQITEFNAGLSFLLNKPQEETRNIYEAHIADTDLRSNIYQNLWLVEGYEYDKKEDIIQITDQYRRSEINNLDYLCHQGNIDDINNRIRIANQYDWQDVGSKYIYETQNGKDKNPFVQSDIDRNLNYLSNYENNGNQEDLIQIANQYDWQDIGAQSGHEYEYKYKERADPEYQYLGANLDSISLFETNRDQGYQGKIANQNLMLKDKANPKDKYQYLKDLENFNKIIEFQNKIAGIDNDSENIAIVIGIDNYDSMPKLHNSVNDADAISKIFNDYKYKVIAITDKSSLAPTKENLEMALSYIGQKYVDKNVLIYYSGHGEIDDKGNFYFVPKDGNDSVSSYISGNEMEQRTGSLDNLAIIIDACNSGAYTVEKPGRLVIASSEGNQKSNEEWFGKLSVFTSSLYKALDEVKTKGKDVVLQDCFRAAYNNTKKWALWPLLRQNPCMIGATDKAYYL
jgi:hypothetical protein